MASEEKPLDERISALLEKAKSGDAIKGVSLGTTSHFYDSTTLYDKYVEVHHGKKYKCWLSAFITDKDNPNNPQELNGLILEAKDRKLLIANGNDEPAWHDAANFHFEKPLKADLTIVSIEKNVADKMDDDRLASGVMTVREAKEAKEQLNEIVKNLEEDVRHSLYETHRDLEYFVPKRDDREFEGRRRQKELRTDDWPGVREVIDIDLSGPDYDALKLRLQYVEKAASRLTERIRSDETNRYRQIEIETVRETTRSQLDIYKEDYAAALRFEQADDQVQEFINNKKPITVERIVQLNTMLRGDDDKRRRGLRDESYPSVHTPIGSYVAGIEVAKASKDTIDWYHKNKGKIPAIELSRKMEEKITSIHFGSDGNTRTGASVRNWVLQEHGIPPVHFNESKDLSRVFTRKQIILTPGKPVDLRTLVDSSASQTNKFSLTEQERAELLQMRQQRSMARIETLCEQVERQLEKLAQIMGPDPQWQKNNTELISTIRSLLEQRKTASSQNSQIESDVVSYCHSQEQLKKLLKRGMQGNKGLLSAKDANGGEISGVINFERSDEHTITITNEMGTRQIALSSISFTKSDRADVNRIIVKDARLTDQQIPQAVAQLNNKAEQQRQINNKLRQLMHAPLSTAEMQQLTQIIPGISKTVSPDAHQSKSARHVHEEDVISSEGEQSIFPIRPAPHQEGQETNVKADEQSLRLMLRQRFEEQNKRQKVLGHVGLSKAHDVSDQQINDAIEVMRTKLNLSGDEIKTVLDNFKKGPIEWKGECSDPSSLVGTRRISTGNVGNSGALFKRDRGLLYVSQDTIDQHLNIDSSNKVTSIKNESGRKSSCCGIFKRK